MLKDQAAEPHEGQGRLVNCGTNPARACLIYNGDEWPPTLPLRTKGSR